MWQYESTTEKFVDMAGKYRVTVLVRNGKEEQGVMLKFQTEPDEALIMKEAGRVCETMNAPAPAPEKTVEQLKSEIVAKDAIIASKDAEISILKTATRLK